jgi:hypothetical protein
MSPENTTQLVLALLGFALVAATLGWSTYGRSVWPPVSMAALAAAAVLAAVSDELSADRVEVTSVVALSGLLAVAGGGPLTVRIFAIVDRGQPAVDSISDAGAILKGGAWIGALERLAVFAGLAAGFPEGVAVVLALKGVGRFPDLRGDAAAGGATTERFIIGTFASVLWAAACAGLVALVRR